MPKDTLNTNETPTRPMYAKRWTQKRQPHGPRPEYTYRDFWNAFFNITVRAKEEKHEAWSAKFEVKSAKECGNKHAEQVMSEHEQRRASLTGSQSELASFSDYCKAHPHERFWQALCNWSGAKFILVSNFAPADFGKGDGWLQDTFAWRRRNEIVPERHPMEKP